VATIANTSLSPGTYIIGAQAYEDGNHFNIPLDATGVTTIPGYTYITSAFTLTPGLNVPNDFGEGFGENGFLYADFSVTPSDTPEPASLTLLAAGCAAFGGFHFVRRRRRATESTQG
jgi:hypothetical protein